MERLSRLPKVTQLVLESTTCLPHWKIRFTCAEPAAEACPAHSEPLYPEQCATHTIVQTGYETAKARSQRKEGWERSLERGCGGDDGGKVEASSGGGRAGLGGSIGTSRSVVVWAPRQERQDLVDRFNLAGRPGKRLGVNLLPLCPASIT